MNTARVVALLEKVRDHLDHGSTGAANQKNATECNPKSTKVARDKLKQMATMLKKDRGPNVIHATRGYPSSTKR